MTLRLERHRHAGHRSVQGGLVRAAVFGVNDGLVSNVALLVGVAAAGQDGTDVRLAGLAALVAGAVSMAVGEYVSVQAQAELLQRELDVERRELVNDPAGETAELAMIYEQRGVAPERARLVAADLMSSPEQALHTHAREELGIDPGELGRPLGAALMSFVCFAVGALLPLLPWFVSEGRAAAAGTVVLGALGALIVGALIGSLAGLSPVRTAARQLALGALATAVAWGIGEVVGTAVG